MRHASSLDLFTHWNERRGNHAAPGRSDIDPAAIRHSLGDVFMLAVDFSGEYRFRLSGTRICSLMGRELKNELFSTLWGEASQPSMQHLLAIMEEEQIGATAGAVGFTTDGLATEFELLLLPLSRQGHARIRAIGVLAPLQLPYWTGVKSISQLEIGTIRHLGTTDELTGAPRFVAAGGGRLRRGFVVHDGGKSGPKPEPEQEKAS